MTNQIKLDIANFRELTAELSSRLLGSKYLLTPETLRLITDVVVEKILNDDETPEEVKSWILHRLVVHHDREFAENASHLDAGDLLIKSGLKSFAIRHLEKESDGSLTDETEEE